MADSRRSFLRAMLAACASSVPYSSALGQIIPSDNAFQAQLSHLYTQQEISFVNHSVESAAISGGWLSGGSGRKEIRDI